MALPSFHLRDIPEDGITVEASLDAATLRAMLSGSEYEPVGDPAGSTRVRIDKHGQDVTLVGSVDAVVRGTCARCLEPVDVKTHAEFALHLTPASAAPPRRAHEEIELSAGDLDQDHYEYDRIELEPWVREQLLLETPTFPQCPEGCTAPIQMPATEEKTEHAVDPRLAPLQKLSNKR